MQGMSRGALPLRVARAAALAIGAFWLGNVFCTYLIRAVPSLTSLGAGQPETIWGFLSSCLRSPWLGISAARPQLAVGGFCALASVAAAEMRGAGKMDNEVPFAHQYDTAAMATPEQAMALAHTSETYGRGRSAVEWRRPGYLEDVLDDNVALAKGCMYAASRIPDRLAEGSLRNRHGFVMATSGSGKTWNWLTSNVLNLPGSMVFLDPKGELFERFAAFLEAMGYVVRVLDLRGDSYMRICDCYDPLHYVSNKTDIDMLVDMFIESTRGKSTSGDQQYFVDMERNLYAALAGMMVYRFKKHGRAEDCNMPAMLDYLSLCGQDAGELAGSTGDQGRTEALDKLDLIFLGTWERDGFCGFAQFLMDYYGREDAPDDPTIPEYAVLENYRGFRSCNMAEETKAGVVSSCFARLQRFNNPSVRRLMRDDSMEIDMLGRRKQAIFVCIESGSENGGPYGFLASMFLDHLFKRNIRVATSEPSGHLPVPVWFFLDEVANLPRIPGLPDHFAVCRGYWMNLFAIVQNMSGLEARYGKETDKIRDNCCFFVFLGTTNYKDAEALSKEMGETTATVRQDSWTESRTGGASHTVSYQAVRRPLRDAKYLMTFNERMPGGSRGLRPDSCIVRAGSNPYFEGMKLDPTEHRRYPMLEDAGPTDLAAWRAAHPVETAAPRGAEAPADGGESPAELAADPASLVLAA